MYTHMLLDWCCHIGGHQRSVLWSGTITMSTTSLLQGHTHNDSVEMTNLYQRYSGAIQTYLLRMVGGRELAEDLCHDTFLKVWCHWSKRQPDANIVSWLYRIATNTAIDALRKRRFQALPLNTEMYVNNTTIEETVATKDSLERLLETVPEQQRTPILLQIYGGWTIQEIADRHGCSSIAIRMRMFRARKHMQNVYIDEDSLSQN